MMVDENYPLKEAIQRKEYPRWWDCSEMTRIFPYLRGNCIFPDAYEYFASIILSEHEELLESRKLLVQMYFQPAFRASICRKFLTNRESILIQKTLFERKRMKKPSNVSLEQLD
jgi:hypothetical protein